MNDRFKFRAWDRINNKWLSNKNCIEIGTGYLTDFFDVEQAFNRRYVLMQCTGLKDKNGKLIYEGDIVRFIYGNKKRLGYVKENKTVWSITNSNFCQGAWCGGALINLYETCEVIGNIYENKELLEELNAI